MIEILFRGGGAYVPIWYEGYVYKDEEYTYIKNSEGMSIVDPLTVSQYVGLKDREGQKIFEGDILESPIKRVDQKHGNLIIVRDIRETKSIALYAAEYKVIGNIYDNPELLWED